MFDFSMPWGWLQTLLKYHGFLKDYTLSRSLTIQPSKHMGCMQIIAPTQGFFSTFNDFVESNIVGEKFDALQIFGEDCHTLSFKLDTQAKAADFWLHVSSNYERYEHHFKNAAWQFFGYGNRSGIVVVIVDKSDAALVLLTHLISEAIPGLEVSIQ